MMEKPILLTREEFRKTLADTINNSNLHPIFIEPILEGFLVEVRASLNKQYQEEKAAYEASLKEGEKEHGSKDHQESGSGEQIPHKVPEQDHADKDRGA